MEQQKIPPQVPPKPRSSRVDENDHIEAELKHIMNGHQQRNNTTPPLPALSPGPGMLGMLLNPGLDSNADSSSPDTRPSRPSRLGRNIFSIQTRVHIFFLYGAMQAQREAWGHSETTLTRFCPFFTYPLLTFVKKF
jgi:hypothetical protein